MNQQKSKEQDGITPTEDSDDDISITKILLILRKRFKWFVTTFLLFLLLAGAYAYFKDGGDYQSQATILIKGAQSLKSSSTSSITNTNIASEIELITSRENVLRALESLDLSTYHNHKGESYQVSEIIENEEEWISVTRVKDTNIVKITVTDRNQAFACDFANALVASLESTFENVLTGVKEEVKTAQRDYIESQIQINDQDLSKANDALREFKISSNITQLSGRSSMLVEQIAYNALHMEPLKLQLSKNLSSIKRFNETFPNTDVVNLLSYEQIKDDHIIASTLEEFEVWTTWLLMYESLMQPDENNPVLSMRIQEIDGTNSQVTEVLTDRVNELTRRYTTEANTQAIVGALKAEVEIDVLSNRTDGFTQELNQLPILEQQLSDLKSNVKIHEDTGAKLSGMLEEINLGEENIASSVTVVEAATISELPIGASKLLIVATLLLLGALVGLVLALGVEVLDVSILEESQIQKISGKSLPIFGWIPLMVAVKDVTYPTLSVYTDPYSYESEQFKLVASMLHYKNERSIYSITSCGKAEGKSTLIGNVALALAQMGNSVLIIDGDLRRPGMERYFRLSQRSIGLIDFVTKGTSPEECLIQPLADIPTLHLLPPGDTAAGTSAIFSSPGYAKGLEQLKHYYDFILIDSPSLESSSDLLPITKSVDGVIITVRAGVTSKGTLKELVSILRTAGAPISGFVFNAVIASTMYSYRPGYPRRFGRAIDTKDKGKLFKLFKDAPSRYRRQYKQDLKNRDIIPSELFEPTLAFGDHAAHKNLSV